MMKLPKKLTLSMIVSATAAFVASSLSAEQIVVYGYAQYADSEIEIVSLEQHDFGVTAITREITGKEIKLEKNFLIPSKPLEVSFPSIAITDSVTEQETWVMDRIPGNILYNIYEPELAVEFDYTKNNGWVESQEFGLINIQDYPVVFHRSMGWIEVLSDKIVNQSNSYWLWTEELGEFWTQKGLFPKVWLEEQEAWRILLMRDRHLIVED